MAGAAHLARRNVRIIMHATLRRNASSATWPQLRGRRNVTLATSVIDRIHRHTSRNIKDQPRRRNAMPREAWTEGGFPVQGGEVSSGPEAHRTEGPLASHVKASQQTYGSSRNAPSFRDAKRTQKRTPIHRLCETRPPKATRICV